MEHPERRKAPPFHARRPLAAAALGYGAGVLAGAFFDWLPFLYVLAFLLAMAVPFLLRRMGKSPVPGWVLAMLMLGLLFGGHAAHPALPDAGRYQVQGVVWENPVLREDGTAAGYLTRVQVTDESGVSYDFSKVYWTFTPDEDAPLLPVDGDAVSFSASLYHPSGQTNPYGFDFRMFLLERGVTVGVSGNSDLAVTGRPGRGIASLLYRARQALAARMDLIFGTDSALPKALLLGERESLPDEVTQHFSDAGISHLLSISGLHVALLAGALDGLLRFFLSRNRRSVFMAGFLVCYCALLGFPAPVVRASLLMGLDRMRRISHRPYDPITSLAFAFLLILLVSPLSLFSISFQLSFCAVLAMAVWGGPLRRRLAALRPDGLRDGVAATVTATAGTFIPCAQCFHRFSLIGLLINPLMCAAFGVLLPLYFAATLAGAAWLPLGQAMAFPLGYATRFLLAAAEFLGDLPFAVVRVPYLPWYAVLAILLAALLSTRFILMNRRQKALLAAAAVCIAGGTWFLSRNTDVTYVQLAMGQADAALILDGRETVVIDAGDYGGDVASYLLSTGRNADTVIVTHLHADHFLGLEKLLDQRVPIGRLCLPVGAEEQLVDPLCVELLCRIRETGVPVEYLAAGNEWALPRCKISVLWPDRDTLRTGQDANLYSLAMLIDLDGVRLMTAGDLDGTFEYYAARDADILKVAHHGSNGSTEDGYLEAVSPSVAIVTGRQGSKILPNVNTLSRLAQHGVSVYNTGEWGALTFRIREGKAVFTPYLLPPLPEEEE